jgi:hypothetical protein
VAKALKKASRWRRCVCLSGQLTGESSMYVNTPSKLSVVRSIIRRRRWLGAARARAPKRPQQKALGRRIDLRRRGQERGPPTHFHVLLPGQVWRPGQVLQGGMRLSGKLGHRGVILAIHPGRLFFVTDSLSNRRYLVDTGSAFSIIPWQPSFPPTGPGLLGEHRALSSLAGCLASGPFSSLP